jgi:hypothetical protein
LRLVTDLDPAADPTPPRPPRPTGPVQYKGEELDPERGPGLGCFRFQLIVLVALIVLTPLSVVWKWPDAVSAVMLFGVILLLLITGQTIIFLLRLVAADRRGRRRPLGSATRTVGELEDEAASGEARDAGEPRNVGEPRAAGEPRDAGEPRNDREPRIETPSEDRADPSGNDRRA